MNWIIGGAVSIGGSSTVDLSGAGTSGTGGDFGTFGGPATAPGGLTLGTGTYVYPASPDSDPYARISVPTAPSIANATTFVPLGTDGCPDPSGCVEFAPGNYALTGSNSCKSSGNLNGTSDVGCLIVPTPYRFNLPSWSQGTYTAGTLIQPNHGQNHGDYVFQVQTGGASGSSQPTWPQTAGLTVTDGSVVWLNVGAISNKPRTAIFQPGLYYVGAEGLQFAGASGSSSESRVTACTAGTTTTTNCNGDGSGGVTFYFSAAGSGSNPGSLSVGSGAGSASACTQISPTLNPSNCVVSYSTAGTTQFSTVGSRAMQCGTVAIPTQIPTTLTGNVLMGPCTGTWGDPNNNYRGFLFYQNRAIAGTPQWGGGGSFVSAGLMYFHQCRSDSTGINCSAVGSGGYGTVLTMGGGSSGNSYAYGNIVADKISLSGGSGLTMILSPSSSYSLLKVQLLR